MYIKIFAGLCLLGLSQLSLAQSPDDIIGRWQAIDEKTGEPTTQIDIKKEVNGTYSGTIKVPTPRVGYEQPTHCVNCPSPYTNQPIVGLKLMTNLKYDDGLNYKNGSIIDPFIGKVYRLSARLKPNGQRLTLRGYIGVSALGRSQTWVRVNQTTDKTSLDN